MDRDDRSTPFRFIRQAGRACNSLGWYVRLQVSFSPARQDVFLQFLGINTHPLPDTPFQISPLFTRASYASTHNFHALLLGIAQIIEETHMMVPLSGPQLGELYRSSFMMPIMCHWKLLLERQPQSAADSR